MHKLIGMTPPLITKHKIAISVITIALVASGLLFGIRAASAVGEEGNWSLFIRSVKHEGESLTYFEASDGSLAYCYAHTVEGPGQDGETYTHLMRAPAYADYIFAKGYPNTRTIGGKTWDAEYAHRVTQWATWIASGYGLKDGYPDVWIRVFGQEVYDAALAFANEAKAYQGGDETIDGIACIAYVDGKADTQPMLLGNQFGHLKIQKKSSDPNLVSGNSSYSLAGAKFGIYTDAACTKLYNNYTLTTDETGVAYDQNQDIVPGTYYIKELEAPQGYQKNETPIKVEVKSARGAEQDEGAFYTTCQVVNKPMLPIQIAKTSSLPDISSDNSCYSLKGAQYSIYKSKSDAERNANAIQTLTTDENGLTPKSKPLEQGMYYVREVKAPDGFALNDEITEVKVDASTYKK